MLQSIISLSFFFQGVRGTKQPADKDPVASVAESGIGWQAGDEQKKVVMALKELSATKTDQR